MTRVAQDPLALLKRMQQESVERAPGLPQEVEVAVLWSGVGFRLTDMMLVAQLDQVTEVLPCPPLTPVPRTKPWVKGVANVRGNLITVIDLPEYFGKPAIFQDERARLMIMNMPGLNAGVLVNEVVGLRHFDEALEKQDLTGLDDPVLVHLTGAFLRDNVLWGIFDMQSLAEAQGFRHVAA